MKPSHLNPIHLAMGQDEHRARAAALLGVFDEALDLCGDVLAVDHVGDGGVFA